MQKARHCCNDPFRFEKRCCIVLYKTTQSKAGRGL